MDCITLLEMVVKLRGDYFFFIILEINGRLEIGQIIT